MLTPDTLVLDGRFRVLRSLGAGGMGEVYLGEQVSLGRRVAIKVLHRDLHLQPGMAERFEREARLLSAVEHPAVVRVIDFGHSKDAACLVMELVEGKSLHDALNESPFPPARALPLLRQLAEGLAAIHDKGIIHRDLKPENVLLTQGPRGEQARLLDFGIARLAEPDAASNLSQVGMVLGTPEYLSPEQAVGARADARSDLYSFGVMAYRVFSGLLPFDGPEARHYLAQHAHGTPRPLLEVAPALAPYPNLVALVMRLLEKDPAHRFPDAHALADALAAADLSVAVPAPAAIALPSAGTQAFGLAAPPAGNDTVAPKAPVHVTEPSGTQVFGGAPPANAAPTALGAPDFVVRPSSPEPALAADAVSLQSRAPEETSPGARQAPRVEPVVGGAKAAWGRLAARLGLKPRQLLVAGAAGALLLSGGALLTVSHYRSPVVQARALLADGKPREALKRLQTVPAEKARKDAAHQRVRARAHHALGEHGDEHAILERLDEEGRAGVETEVLDGLAEDFAATGDRSLRKLLGTFEKAKVKRRFKELAEAEEASLRQWGALRYLVLEKSTDGLNLRRAYSTALTSKLCAVRARAARELAELGDADAIPALTKLAELPKEKGFISAKNCGQDEAAAAIRKLKK